jgi:hypothetical protein
MYKKILKEGNPRCNDCFDKELSHIDYFKVESVAVCVVDELPL